LEDCVILGKLNDRTGIDSSHVSEVCDSSYFIECGGPTPIDATYRRSPMKLTNRYSTFRITALVATLYVAAAGSLFAQLPTQATMVMANDNRHPAGILADGVLRVRLFARQGQWRPEESDGPTLDVAAFGEESGSLVIPSPLLRAVEGTDIIVHVEND